MGHKSTARPVETPLDNKSILNSRIRVIEDKILGKVTILK